MELKATSNTVEWYTPPEIFLPLQAEFGLDMDVCAADANAARLPQFFSPQQDGLAQDWHPYRCWMNPPYGRAIVPWVKKAALGGARVVVALLPVRSDTAWWHDYVMPTKVWPGAEVRFMRGRVKFLRPDGLPADPAPFPTCIAIWH